MKKFLIAIVAMFALSFTAPVVAEQYPMVQNQEQYVIICTGPNATKYHSTSRCKGLSNCSGELKQVSESAARASGRSACKICF